MSINWNVIYLITVLKGMGYFNLILEITPPQKKVIRSHFQSIFYRQMQIDQPVQEVGKSTDASQSSKSLELMSLSKAPMTVVVKSQSKQRWSVNPNKNTFKKLWECVCYKCLTLSLFRCRSRGWRSVIIQSLAGKSRGGRKTQWFLTPKDSWVNESHQQTSQFPCVTLSEVW